VGADLERRVAWFSHLLDAYDPGRLGRAVDVRTTALDRASGKGSTTMSAPTPPANQPRSGAGCGALLAQFIALGAVKYLWGAKVALAAFVVAVVVAVVVKAVKAEGEAKTAEAVAALPDKEAGAITVRSITAEEARKRAAAEPATLDEEEKPTAWD
jgi:hypothetical protein